MQNTLFQCFSTTIRVFREAPRKRKSEPFTLIACPTSQNVRRPLCEVTEGRLVVPFQTPGRSVKASVLAVNTVLSKPFCPGRCARWTKSKHMEMSQVVSPENNLEV